MVWLILFVYLRVIAKYTALEVIQRGQFSEFYGAYELL